MTTASSTGSLTLCSPWAPGAARIGIGCRIMPDSPAPESPTPNSRSGPEPAKTPRLTRLGPFQVATLLFALAFAFSLPALRGSGRSLDHWDNIKKFLGQFVPPDFSVGPQAWGALIETGRMAVLATTFASLLAIAIAPLAARTIAPPWIVWPARLFLNLIRSIPSLVWALLAVAVVGANSQAGVIALTAYSLGYLGKFFSDAFEAVDTRATDALRATGAHPVQAFQYGLWPEVKPLIWSHALWMLEYNVRAGTIIGYVGAGGIGTLLYTYQEFYQWSRFAAVLCLILTVVTALDLAGARLRAALAGPAPPAPRPVWTG
jgi:phosphonate transport system permease protein